MYCALHYIGHVYGQIIKKILKKELDIIFLENYLNYHTDVMRAQCSRNTIYTCDQVYGNWAARAQAMANNHFGSIHSTFRL